MLVLCHQGAAQHTTTHKPSRLCFQLACVVCSFCSSQPAAGVWPCAESAAGEVSPGASPAHDHTQRKPPLSLASRGQLTTRPHTTCAGRVSSYLRFVCAAAAAGGGRVSARCCWCVLVDDFIVCGCDTLGKAWVCACAWYSSLFCRIWGRIKLLLHCSSCALATLFCQPRSFSNQHWLC